MNNMNSRSSGILLHPTSLPGPAGIGDLGPQARLFVDFLELAGQRYWQILPLGPTGHWNSPYQSLSSFAGNPLLINLDELVQEGLLTGSEIEEAPGREQLNDERVDYVAVEQCKKWCLEHAYAAFLRRGEHHEQSDFRTFCDEEKEWLDDFALFVALKEQHGGASWENWERGALLRIPEAIDHWNSELRAQVQAHKFYQYLFFRQWRRLKRYANDHGVQIVGDMPVFVAYDGADVWAHPHLFFLDDDRRPTVVAGVPPDYFSPTGQLWGNPLYRWDRMAKDGYSWWINRVRKTLELVDLVRLDHFRGFEAYWEVSASEKTATNGRWVTGPGAELFSRLEASLGRLPFIAEDLGVITPEVEKLRDQFQQPGMKVLHFAFGGNACNPYLPHNHIQNCVIYTGTHDNDTTLGWFESLEEDERRVVETYLGHQTGDICVDLLRMAFASVANTAIVPIQDLLGLGSDSRMNIPGIGEGNWAWRLKPRQLSKQLAIDLRRVTEFYGRLQGSEAELKDLVSEALD
jgi:4-alpha-glucanotransferase